MSNFRSMELMQKSWQLQAARGVPPTPYWAVLALDSGAILTWTTDKRHAVKYADGRGVKCLIAEIHPREYGGYDGG